MSATPAPIVFGSYCAGIEAASVASAPFGWRSSYLCEIAAHPRAVLRHRHGARDAGLARPAGDAGPMLWGDFTALRPRHLARLGVAVPDVICGGTPCQAFSRAGKRGSLDDARGNLTLEFVRQVHAIDNLRSSRGQPGVAVLWENVPGVLNTPDNAFGCFLGGLVGADAPVEGLPNAKAGADGAGGDGGEDAVERFGKWPDAGLVEGPWGRAAWRVLDAQFFGLAQRRNRVFVVFGARDRLDPAAVLLERQGLSRDPPARGKAGEGPAVDVAPSLTASGRGVERAGETRGQDPVVAVAFGGNDRSGPIDVSTALNACGTASGRQDFDSETFVVQAFDGRQSDVIQYGDLSGPLDTDPGSVAVCFSSKDFGGDAEIDLAPTLRAGGHDGSHANGGVPPAVAYSVRTNQTGQNGPGYMADLAPTISADESVCAVAFALRGREDGAQVEVSGEVVSTLRAGGGGSSNDYVAQRFGVRRLTPTECERLQGFPDGFTAVPWKGGTMPDGPRYKMLGNSWAVDCVRWIIARMDAELRAGPTGTLDA